ncbi:MAG TPA: aldolase/citrate lyase family protein, partial [Vicinamibacterales bacterium]
LAALAERIEALEAARGLERGAIRVVPTVESAAGLMRVPELATAPRIAAFAFGATDFAADLGAEPGPDERETLLARSWLVLASRAAGVGAPIASVHTKLDDEEGLRRTTMEARRLGFWGRSCIHPKQLAIVHEVFTPTADQIADARAVLEAFQQQVAAGQASFRLGDRFVDRAVAARAARLLARVERPLA